ncbi:hypothetical protein H4O20_05190 [Aequorivita sp. 609]|uniref:hypothetical protein n=1 Tax=Aequorivita TaxID=153265 RepID=UPI0016107D0B|nr:MULTISPECIES: hypothetical protein [Aequorivita]MBB6680831.1 hypothetical protein [Aequorivita sp. 609]
MKEFVLKIEVNGKTIEPLDALEAKLNFILQLYKNCTFVYSITIENYWAYKIGFDCAQPDIG